MKKKRLIFYILVNIYEKVMGNRVYFLLVITIYSFTAVTAQVGIGTTNPQAQLEVAGGNVRFSDYGVNNHTGITANLLGVEADGDVIEKQFNRGLVLYSWQGIPFGGNPPPPEVIDMNDIYEFAPGGTMLGAPDRSELYTGGLQLTGAALITALSPGDDNGFLVILRGTLIVKNEGDFTFNSDSDDGSRIHIDQTIVLNDWENQGTGTVASTTVHLAAGRHQIAFWYYERGGLENMDFTWGANPDGYPVGSAIQANQFFIE